MDPLKEVRNFSFGLLLLELLFCSLGECYYEESLRDASGLFSLSEEDLEDEDILRPDDLCLFKININMGKKDKTVSP